MLNTTRKIIILLVFFVITSLAWVTSQSTCDGTLHTVQTGENLFRISLNYGVDMDTVAQLNGIDDPTRIFSGQSICIPTNGTTGIVPPQTSTNNTNSQQTTTTTTVSSVYFIPCEDGVECVPDQTQVHFHQGFNRCVSAKLTSNGLGWTPAEPEWCNWTNVITHSWDDVTGSTVTVITTTGDNSSNENNSSGDSGSSDDTSNNGSNDGTNLCFDGNDWAGQCDSDFMWKAGYYVAQYQTGQIALASVPAEFRVMIGGSSGSSDDSSSSNNNDDDDDNDSSSNNDDSSSDDSSGDSSGGDSSGSDSSGGDSSGGDSSGGDSSGGDSSGGDSSGGDSSGGDSSGGDSSGGDSSGGDSSGGDSSGGDSSGGDSSGGDSSGGDSSGGDSSGGDVTADDCRSNPSVLPLSSAPSVGNNANGLLTLVNWARNYCGGLSSLSLNSRLNTASQRHSQDMADRNYFSHTAQAPAPNGSSPGDRARDAGYNSYSGENIAAGNSNMMSTFTQWWNSGGHRRNILGNHTQMGYGYGYNGSATYRHYNTQMFGRG